MRMMTVKMLREITEEMSALLKWIDDFEESDEEVAEELIRLKKKEKMLDYIGDNYINLEVVDVEMAMNCRNIPEDARKELEEFRASRSVFKESVRKDL